MEQELKPVVSLLAKNRWPFRLHATYDESITRALNVYEEVNREIPAAKACTGSSTTRKPSRSPTWTGSRRWAAESPFSTAWRFRASISATGTEAATRNGLHPIQRNAADGAAGGRRHRRDARRHLQPLRLALLAGNGEDGRRLRDVRRGKPPRPHGSSAPVDCREQLVLDRTGYKRFDRRRASLRTSLCCPRIIFRSPRTRSRTLESVLTIVGGKPVYAAEEFADLAPPLPPVLPEWSPVAAYGGYHKPATAPAVARSACRRTIAATSGNWRWDGLPLLGFLATCSDAERSIKTHMKRFLMNAIALLHSGRVSRRPETPTLASARSTTRLTSMSTRSNSTSS